jgi:glycosyltransferase involved in cell wall biosynthesis
MESPHIFPPFDRIFLPVTTAIIALSETHRRHLQEVDSIDPEKIVVIENGIATQRFDHVDAELVRKTRAALPVSERDRLVIMIALLRPVKAHEALISAAALLSARRDDIKFLIVGDGPRKHQLETMVRDLQLGEKVLFLGERHDVATLLHLSDVLVLPSHSEGLPLVVIEAMAAGVPVVASAVGSIPEMIEDRINGKLIGPADANALASAIADLLDDAELSRRLIENARNTVQSKYTLDKMVSKYEEFFDRLAKFT